ncbi:sulfotransferase domain-containing protein [Sphingopyxis sp. KK2]|uniref:sulfotransferase domain-containing protein n=1 Tax=Sphingopyxis sp. KK2 TaxID=1855727 RepID=UPI00097E5CA3|nr:sulfotransferase domain-containing protein [Sphingopyxis sp. KK2]
MYLPNLLVIGAMKCGTSSLHDYLSLHPDIFMSEEKELNWFAGSNYGKSVEWYMRNFPVNSPIRGESSQNYSKRHAPRFIGAPGRIWSLIPDVKIIYLVRDPIDRLLSHEVENYHGELPAGKEQAERIENHVLTGLYFYQLELYLEYFSQEQILVVDSYDLLNRRYETMGEIHRFLGLAPLEDMGAYDFVTNDNASNGVPVRWQASLPYRVARRVLPFDLNAALSNRSISRRLFPRLTKRTLSPAEVERYKERFSPDVERLRALTGKAFASWQV